MSSVTIVCEGKKVTLKLKKWSWKRKREFQDLALGKVKITNGQIGDIDVDLGSFKEALVITTVVDAPFELNTESLGKLDAEEFEKLFDASSKVNSFRNILQG